MDALELLDELVEDQRDELLRPIFENLTRISHNVILEFQEHWGDENGSLRDFVHGQNLVIRECIKAEMTGFGRMVRKEEGLPPLENGTILF